MSLEHIHQIKELVSRDQLRVLMRRTDRHAWLYLVQHLLLIGVTGYLVYLTLGTWLLVPAMAVHGVGIVHLFSAQHEFAHRTAFRTRWLNDFFGWIVGLTIILPNVYFRWEHTEHHSYTQNSRRDPQHIPTPKKIADYVYYLSSLPYWWGFLKPFISHLAGIVTADEKRFVPKTERFKLVLEAWAMLGIYALIAVVMLLGETLAPLYYWLIPRLLAEPYMRFVRMTEHVGRPTDETNLLVNTRTTIVGPLSSRLAWNMPFHAEHHLSPSVPFHALPNLYDMIKGHHVDIANGYSEAHRDILRSLRASTISP